MSIILCLPNGLRSSHLPRVVFFLQHLSATIVIWIGTAYLVKYCCESGCYSRGCKQQHSVTKAQWVTLNFKSQELAPCFVQRGMTIFASLVKMSSDRRKKITKFLATKWILLCFPTEIPIFSLPLRLWTIYTEFVLLVLLHGHCLQKSATRLSAQIVTS